MKELNMKKLHFIFDKSTKRAQNLKKLILRRYKNFSPKKSDYIVVAGGDGFMLNVLKKFQKYNKPFYGINTGTFGFLMNKYQNINLDKLISKTKLVLISPLKMKAFTKYGKSYSAIAVNEVSLLRQSRQTASLKIINNKKTIIRKLICDGVLISTPAGSTAYNLSVHGPILSLNSNKLAITPISPFRPRRWKGKIVTSSSIIEIKNLDIRKRPVSVVADNFEVRNVKNVRVQVNPQIRFKLLYDKNNNLNQKINLEKFKKR